MSRKVQDELGFLILCLCTKKKKYPNFPVSTIRTYPTFVSISVNVLCARGPQTAPTFKTTLPAEGVCKGGLWGHSLFMSPFMPGYPCVVGPLVGVGCGCYLCEVSHQQACNFPSLRNKLHYVKQWHGTLFIYLFFTVCLVIMPQPLA